MFFELNRRVIFFLHKDFEKFHEIFYGGDVNENRHFIEGEMVAHNQKFYATSFMNGNHFIK